MRTDCPHCQEKARVRTSRAVTPTYRQLNFECTNFDCRHTFAAALEILHTIAPSQRPNPEVHLRMAPPRMRSVPGALPANDNGAGLAAISPPGGPEVPLPLAANDDDGLAEAVGTGG